MQYFCFWLCSQTHRIQSWTCTAFCFSKYEAIMHMWTADRFIRVTTESKEFCHETMYKYVYFLYTVLKFKLYNLLQYNYSILCRVIGVCSSKSFQFIEKLNSNHLEFFFFCQRIIIFLLRVLKLLDQSLINIWCHISNTISFSLISSSDSCWIILALFQCKINTNYLYMCVYMCTHT